MQPVHTRDELRAADQAAIAEVGLDILVARAGAAVAHGALGMLGGAYGSGSSCRRDGATTATTGAWPPRCSRRPRCQGHEIDPGRFPTGCPRATS